MPLRCRRWCGHRRVGQLAGKCSGWCPIKPEKSKGRQTEAKWAEWWRGAAKTTIYCANIAAGLMASAAGKVTRMRLLGHPGDLEWSQTTEGLAVKPAAQKPRDHALALEVQGTG